MFNRFSTYYYLSLSVYSTACTSQKPKTPNVKCHEGLCCLMCDVRSKLSVLTLQSNGSITAGKAIISCKWF